MIPAENHIFMCPGCGTMGKHQRIFVQVSHNKYHSPLKITQGDKPHKAFAELLHVIYQCDICNAETYFLYHGVLCVNILALTEVGDSKVLHQFPISSPTKDTSIPVEIAKSMIEAEKCLAVQAYNACGVMARRAMHAMCDDKKAKGGNLYDQLKYLKDNHIITKDLWEWAEELRIGGRSGAHTEWEEVTAKDADYVVEFLNEILRYMYINPAARAHKRLKETKKKK